MPDLIRRTLAEELGVTDPVLTAAGFTLRLLDLPGQFLVAGPPTPPGEVTGDDAAYAAWLAPGERLDGVVRREFGGVYAGLAKGDGLEMENREALRATLFTALGQAGEPEVLAEALTDTQTLLAGRKPTDAAMADAAMALTAAKGDAAMYEKMLRLAQSATDPDLKQDALRTLTRFQAPELVVRTLEYAVSDKVRSQDSWTLIAQLLSRRETQDAAWAFVQQHWDEIAQRAAENSGTRIVAATGAFCSVERRDEVTSFFAAHPIASARRTLARSIDSIDDCIHLRAAQEPELRRWLDAQMAQ